MDNKNQPIPEQEPKAPTPPAPEVDTDLAGARVVDEQNVESLVQDIERADSDAIISQQDAELAEPIEIKASKSGRLRRFFRSWWMSKLWRYGTIMVLTGLLLAAMCWPVSRYKLLNSLGARASVHVTILDATFSQPIKNVAVTIAGQTVQTDDKGRALFTHRRLGSATIVSKKRSYITAQQTVTLGWGSNPLAPIKLVATGESYTFMVVDWLSGKPLKDVTVKESDSVAVTDSKGMAVVKIDTKDRNGLSFSIGMKAYRTVSLAVSVGETGQKTIKLVTGAPHFFISKRSGTLDLYQIDADGKNEKLLLKGTGKERDDISIVPNDAHSLVAYVSTGKGVVDKNGYALQTLWLMDPHTKQMTEVAESEELRVIGWHDDSLVYLRIAAGASAADPNRQRLVSYDSTLKQYTQLVSYNGFNTIQLVGDRVYYAPAAWYDPSVAGLYSVLVDGTGKRTHSTKDTWSVQRVAYDTLYFSTSDSKWYSYSIDDNKVSDLATPTAAPADRHYNSNSANSVSAWYDYRDGKGVILLWNIAASTERLRLSQGGLTEPLQWLDDTHLIYRIKTTQETADYIINISDGNAQKITDVFAANTNSYHYY